MQMKDGMPAKPARKRKRLVTKETAPAMRSHLIGKQA